MGGFLWVLGLMALIQAKKRGVSSPIVSGKVEVVLLQHTQKVGYYPGSHQFSA